MDRGDKRIPLEIWASPIRDDEGNVNAAVAVFQDITQRKQAEAELALYQKQLEQLVNIRTTELDQVNQRLQLRLEWLYEVIKIQQMIKGVEQFGIGITRRCVPGSTSCSNPPRFLFYVGITNGRTPKSIPAATRKDVLLT